MSFSSLFYALSSTHYLNAIFFYPNLIKVGLMSQLVPVPLGVSTGKILDGQMTSSSAMNVYHVANQARLHNEKQGRPLRDNNTSFFMYKWLILSSLFFSNPFSDRKGGAWLPRQHDVNPYLQVDLGHVTTVQQVATQGNPASAARNERYKRWVTRFSLEFSQDGINWTECQESGELKVPVARKQNICCRALR